MSLSPGASPAKEHILESSQSMNQFLAAVERRAYRMAELASGNRDDALDIVQDAMLTFVRSYSSRSEPEWTPLFYRVLQSRITDWHRRNTLRSRFRVWFGNSRDEGENEETVESFPDERSPDPAREALRREKGRALEEALATLSQRQRQAFLLRAWEGFDTADTALIMGCSEGSVKTHFSRAVHALREILEDYRHED